MSQAQTLSRKVTIGDRLIRFVQGWRRTSRLLFVSPAEVRFVHVMGGKALTLPFIKSTKTGFPLTFLRLGKVLKRELIKREVQVGNRHYCIDFATRDASYKKGIDITSSYHTDIVADQERDDYLRARGWDVLYIKAARLQRDPVGVRRDVLKFLRT